MSVILKYDDNNSGGRRTREGRPPGKGRIQGDGRMLDVRRRSTYTRPYLIIHHTGAILLLALSMVRVLVARCLCNVFLWNIVVIRTWCDTFFYRYRLNYRRAHAALSPWQGQNALDAAVAAYTNVALLRQQVKPSHRIHGIFKGDDWAANGECIVPSLFACIIVGFQSYRIMRKCCEICTHSWLLT